MIAELRAAGFDDADEVGRGGFGVVYRCMQAGLDRAVAVKVLSATLDDENKARFLREQRAMGRLTGHPNIVGILQVGQTPAGRPYLVMQYHQRGSLDTWIRTSGPLPVADVLRLGVKMAAALDTVHRLGIVHRDVKPANILFTDYGEPALTDFGIAHIAGGFQTATGMVTGSPAFTAPEILDGAPATPASDVYGLGSTMFCALTGHAAFERHSGEKVVAQFLRIRTQPVSDLRETGIPDDVSVIIEAAMARDPQQRPSPAELGEALRLAQDAHGLPVESVAERTDPGTGQGGDSEIAAGVAVQKRGILPAELTSFVGRRAEISEVRRALGMARLVTLTGVGGVGKTRLALHAAAAVEKSFPGGVWLIELGEIRDPALVVGLVAATVGVPDSSARPLPEVLADALSSRATLLVLDNCEQLIEGVAQLTQNLLSRCPDLRILVTSREALAVGGEFVLRMTPLATPPLDQPPSVRQLPKFDALTLFAERAASVLPGFEITDDTVNVISQICSRLDGIPLAIELAAARLRVLTPAQLLQRLTDRYALLTHGSRSVPTRQQTLRWSIAWSYDLCTPAEQQLWGRLSVFASSFDLDAVESVCGGGGGGAEKDLLDNLTSLVDKSILIREESGGEVRFRLLETLRDFGRERLDDTGESLALTRRHRDWYQRLAMSADAEWVSARQLEWAARLARELPNLRQALESSLAEGDTTRVITSTQTLWWRLPISTAAHAFSSVTPASRSQSGLRIAAALCQFWIIRGLMGEGRRWLDRGLAGPRPPGSGELAKALMAACELALLQGDLAAATVRAEELHALSTQQEDSLISALAAYAEGWLALFNGEIDRAQSSLKEAVQAASALGVLTVELQALMLLGWTHQSSGQTSRAVTYHEEALAIAESHGDSVYRSYALWSMGVSTWRNGDSDRAERLIGEALRLTRVIGNQITTAIILQSLAWIAAEQQNSRRAAILTGAADTLSHTVGTTAVFFPNLLVYHEEHERTVHRRLDARAFDRAYREGKSLSADAAIAFALNERIRDGTSAGSGATELTERERQVADLIVDGLTNKAIATRLAVSLRTVDGHVAHILSKRGFTSRAQIAAWVVEQEHAPRT
ncbi:protein kinase domain-containing protein [Nocardia tengchongensis]